MDWVLGFKKRSHPSIKGGVMIINKDLVVGIGIGVLIANTWMVICVAIREITKMKIKGEDPKGGK